MALRRQVNPSASKGAAPAGEAQRIVDNPDFSRGDPRP
jgi:hypothetical protein